MDPKNKFSPETVRQLQQSLEDVAPYQATELSKQQAIRELSPQIVSLRSKGYSWTAIAAMLSEHGVPVSVAALRTYLRRVRVEAENEAHRPVAKRSRDGRTVARLEPPTPIVTSPAPCDARSPQAKPQTPGAAPASAVLTPRAPTAATPRRAPEPRPSTFAVREDTEDI
jgi:hypothetical protein